MNKQKKKEMKKKTKIVVELYQQIVEPIHSEVQINEQTKKQICKHMNTF